MHHEWAASTRCSRSMSTRELGACSAGRLAMNCWWRSCVESTPTSAMLSAFENCAVAAAACARHFCQQLAPPHCGSKTPAVADRRLRQHFADLGGRVAADEAERVGRADTAASCGR